MRTELCRLVSPAYIDLAVVRWHLHECTDLETTCDPSNPRPIDDERSCRARARACLLSDAGQVRPAPPAVGRLGHDGRRAGAAFNLPSHRHRCPERPARVGEARAGELSAVAEEGSRRLADGRAPRMACDLWSYKWVLIRGWCGCSCRRWMWSTCWLRMIRGSGAMDGRMRSWRECYRHFRTVNDGRGGGYHQPGGN